jgi:hypothetical protein
MTDTKTPKGFATLTIERRREIASMGGKAAQASPHGRRFNSETGRQAAKVGWARRHAAKAP